MKIDNVEFAFDEAIPQELEGKTLEEVFGIAQSRVKEILPRFKKGEGISVEDSFYLRLAQMLKKMATGDMSNVKLGVKSPLSL